MEELQKDMMLAKSMVQNGLASSIDDALRKIRKQKEEKMAQETQQNNTNQTSEQASIDPNMVARVKKMEDVLQDFGKFFMEYKQNQFSKVTDLAKDVNALKDQLSQIQLAISQLKSGAIKTEPKVEEPVKQEAPQPVEQPIQQPQPVQQPQPAQQPKQEPSQRTGHFKSEDVCIEKIFSNADNRMTRRQEEK